jgi:hypothetical protein
MQAHFTLAVTAFVGLMMVAASTAHDGMAPPAPASLHQPQGTPVRIPDPIPLPVGRPAPKIVVDLK